MAIHFFQEDVSFALPKKLIIKKWLKSLAEEEGYRLKNLNYIFCSDEFLYEMNLNYLQHDTYTDILTFDTSDDQNELDGDIFISIDRVKDNAKNRNETFEQELSRVICHGLFHLCGFKDKFPEEIKTIRDKEDKAIRKLSIAHVPRGTIG